MTLRGECTVSAFTKRAELDSEGALIMELHAFRSAPMSRPFLLIALEAFIVDRLFWVDSILGESATRQLELRGDIPASDMGSRSATPLLRNPTDVRHCSQHAGANVDFGDEGAVDWAFLGNLKQLRALLLG